MKMKGLDEPDEEGRRKTSDDQQDGADDRSANSADNRQRQGCEADE